MNAPAGGGTPGGFGRTILERLGRPLRVGGIDYLNSRPLIEGLLETFGDGIELGNWVPSELARRLRIGLLDAALVPVVEYFRGPEDYRVVPGVAIASYGAVESIRFYHRRPLVEVARIGLDASSLTSSLLVRLLFAAQWSPGRPEPEMLALPPEAGQAALRGDGGDPDVDAVLLIGDAALGSPAPPGWRMVDLGTEWTRRTGLPFVYAFWVYRGPAVPGLAEAFRRSRDIGTARIDAIVERGPLPPGMSVAEARRYLHKVIQFDLGPAQVEGLLEFWSAARAQGLLGSMRESELRFVDGGCGGDRS